SRPPARGQAELHRAGRLDQRRRRDGRARRRPPPHRAAGARHRGARQAGARRGQARAVRGGPGDDARPRVRHLPLRHQQPPHRGRHPHRRRREPQGPRRGLRRREGVHHARRARAVPHGGPGPRPRAAPAGHRRAAVGRVRHDHGPRPEGGLARPGAAQVRLRDQRLRRPGAHEARRALGPRPGARLRRLRAGRGARLPRHARLGRPRRHRQARGHAGGAPGLPRPDRGGHGHARGDVLDQPRARPHLREGGLVRAVLVAAALLLVLAAAVLALGWVLSSRVVVPAPYSLMPEFEVVASDPGPPVTVTLPRMDSGRQHADVDANGTYALVWDGGYGLLGEAVADAGGAVTRRLDVVEGELPAAGAPARIDNFVYRRDPLRDHGLAFEDLTLRGPVGNVRAWYVPPAPERSRSRSGALVLHGRRRGELIETLRFVPLLHDLGLHVLAQSYRNHDASDPSPDGLYHYGASEWEDALAGARELRRRGVDRVVLFGISMGGAIALEALERWGGD